jgi:hypothetical protein
MTCFFSCSTFFAICLIPLDRFLFLPCITYDVRIALHAFPFPFGCLGRYTGYHHDHEHESFHFFSAALLFFLAVVVRLPFGPAIFPVERFFALQKVGGTRGVLFGRTVQ